MHPRRHLTLFVLVCAAAVGPAFAQAADSALEPPSWEGEPLSLPQSVAEALSRNPSLLAATAATAAWPHRAAAERALMPPRLDAQIWQWPLTTANPADVDMYMFMIEQDLPSRAKRRARAAAVEGEAQAAHAEVAERRLEVAADVRRAYLAVGLARRDLESTHQTHRALRQMADVAEAIYTQGGGTQASLVRTLLEISRVAERSAALRGEERAARARLNALLGRSPDAAIGALDRPGTPGDLTDRPDAVGASAERHPRIRTARASVDQAELAAAAARMERRPDWMLQGGYMLMPGEAGAWTARVGLTWPHAPWARTRLTASIAEADARTTAARAAVAAAEIRTREELETAFLRFEAARERLAVLRSEVIPRARHLVDATRLAFQNGQVTLAETLEARQVLLEAELDEARAEFEAELARVEWDVASGDDWLAAPPFRMETQ
jgi:outer membrane protein TolC